MTIFIQEEEYKVLKEWLEKEDTMKPQDSLEYLYDLALDNLNQWGLSTKRLELAYKILNQVIDEYDYYNKCNEAKMNELMKYYSQYLEEEEEDDSE